MFSRLSESIKKTIAVADGWKLGRLIFEGENYEQSLIETEDREYLQVTNYVVEVLNDGEWHTMTEEDYKRVTAEEGWPLFGGFVCRFKEREQGGDASGR